MDTHDISCGVVIRNKLRRIKSSPAVDGQSGLVVPAVLPPAQSDAQNQVLTLKLKALLGIPVIASPLHSSGPAVTLESALSTPFEGLKVEIDVSE